MSGQTLYEKLWASHVVSSFSDGSDLLYVDRHLLQEVSTHQSFATLGANGRAVRRPDAAIAIADHSVPTRGGPIADPLAAAMVARLAENAAAHGIAYVPVDGADHGILHVTAPEMGLSLPGALIVCGDSHTSTHGALGALAFGIGASECEVVLATQCLRQYRARTMRLWVDGALAASVSAKDLGLALIAQLGAGGMTGFAVEFAGPAVAALDMAGRMTLCNLAIEGGARIGLIAPDATTIAWVKGRRHAPAGALWERAVADWQTLASDPDARFDREERINAGALAPFVTWGTSPHDGVPVDQPIPAPRDARMRRALDYMGLTPGDRLSEVGIDAVFIGSCANGRVEDLRAAAAIINGHRVAPGVRALVVPGSARVRREAEAEGLDRIFLAAGFEWRSAGCSLCVAMNDDRLAPGERCASTSNRNFEGRQGRGARTHLMSPATAAASAIAGRIADPRGFGTRA